MIHVFVRPAKLYLCCGCPAAVSSSFSVIVSSLPVHVFYFSSITTSHQQQHGRWEERALAESMGALSTGPALLLGSAVHVMK